MMKAYLLKEALQHLWDYKYEGAAVRYLKGWVGQLRWQRLPAFEKLANMLAAHLDGILNYCRRGAPGSEAADRSVFPAQAKGEATTQRPEVRVGARQAPPPRR